MMSSKVDSKGRKVADRGNTALSMEVVKLLKTQDAGYIRTMLQMARKERQELEQRLILEEDQVRALKDRDGGVKSKHRVFVENEEEQEDFDPEAWFGRGEDIPTKLTSQSSGRYSEDSQSEEWEDEEDDTEVAPRLKPLSKKQLEAQKAAEKEGKVFNKTRKRAQSRTAYRLEMAKNRERQLVAAEEELEKQRAKMNNSVGGTNKYGVKFKIRERKR